MLRNAQKILKAAPTIGAAPHSPEHVHLRLKEAEIKGFDRESVLDFAQGFGPGSDLDFAQGTAQDSAQEFVPDIGLASGLGIDPEFGRGIVLGHQKRGRYWMKVLEQELRSIEQFS
jgi:hypothetical protein